MVNPTPIRPIAIPTVQTYVRIRLDTSVGHMAQQNIREQTFAMSRHIEESVWIHGKLSCGIFTPTLLQALLNAPIFHQHALTHAVWLQNHHIRLSHLAHASLMLSVVRQLFPTFQTHTAGSINCFQPSKPMHH